MDHCREMKRQNKPDQRVRELLTGYGKELDLFKSEEGSCKVALATERSDAYTDYRRPGKRTFETLKGFMKVNKYKLEQFDLVTCEECVLYVLSRFTLRFRKPPVGRKRRKRKAVLP